MSSHELKLFLNILDDYISHFQKNPESLLAKIYGVFTITFEG
eukprot:CAMPEP_0116872964 /NCGR_PEP_ID=MMETSP0463-20121206/3912_1 /TAXON_ID=181622 /ORGANISM="Strombidinopsis sp, Strain SopsisLIS2011" /LENGTH=41 /DNA_ID= /DNA_START= /DNA_END= /DNA_ORIENTATION=